MIDTLLYRLYRFGMVDRILQRARRISRKGAEEARREFPALVERASRGELTVITKHGKDYAALVPASAVELGAGRVDFLALRGSGRGLWGKSVKRSIARMRDEWR